MSKNSTTEYTGFSKDGIADAVNHALSKAHRPFDSYEIIETFSNQGHKQQEKNYQVTLKTMCETEG